MRYLFPLLGAGLLALLVIDVFMTVFHASGRGGPLNRWQNGALWAGFLALGIRKDGSPRSRMLGLAGPIMVITTLLVWMGLLVFGSALVYLPFMTTFLVSPGSLRSPWLEALYYSTYTAGTLGLGDVVANRGWLRLMTGVQALGGFALISVSITYLLSVYGQVTAMRTVANQISGYFAEGVAVTLRRVEEAGAESFARWAENLTGAFLTMLQAQFQYPVMNYFRPAERSRALPVQLGNLLEFRRMLEHERNSETLRSLAVHPSYLAMTRALDEYLSGIEHHFVPPGFLPDPQGAEDGPERTRIRLSRYMGYQP